MEQKVKGSLLIAGLLDATFCYSAYSLDMHGERDHPSKGSTLDATVTQMPGAATHCALQPVLTVLYHPGIEPGEVGQQLRLDDEPAVAVGRGARLLGRRLDDPELSRDHMSVNTTGAGTHSVMDNHSKNGTWILRTSEEDASIRGRVRAAPGEEVKLSEGDIISAGRLFLLYERSDPYGAVPHVHQVQVANQRRVFYTASEQLRLLVARLQEAAQGQGRFFIIEGPTGTGKEYLARLLAVHGPTRGALVAHSMATDAADPALVHSELFGHRKGAFAGATRDRPGLFRAAEGGTLFLDELGASSAQLQSMLLRSVDPGMIKPLGADREIPVDVRLVVATSTPVQELIDSGQLREDLYGRAEEVFSVPPLCRRPADVMAIAVHHLINTHGCVRDLSNEVVSSLLRAPWSLNVRQLLRAVAAIHKANLGGAGALDVMPPMDGLPGPSSPASREEEVAAAYQRHRGNVTRAAAELGIARKNFYKWLNRAREAGLV